MTEAEVAAMALEKLAPRDAPFNDGWRVVAELEDGIVGVSKHQNTLYFYNSHLLDIAYHYRCTSDVEAVRTRLHPAHKGFAPA